MEEETIKSYTDLPQSKKLTEILPLESADMYYHYITSVKSYHEDVPKYVQVFNHFVFFHYDIPCWSLAALLDILPKEVEIDGQRYAPCLFPIQDKWLLKLYYNSNHTITSPIAIFSDNPVDTCYELILKLHELKML